MFTRIETEVLPNGLWDRCHSSASLEVTGCLDTPEKVIAFLMSGRAYGLYGVVGRSDRKVRVRTYVIGHCRSRRRTAAYWLNLPPPAVDVVL